MPATLKHSEELETVRLYTGKPSALVLRATPTQAACAYDLATARTLFHDKQSRKSDADLGVRRNAAIDNAGVLAELLIRSALDDAEIPYTASPLFAPDVPHGADLTIDGVTFDVKAIPPSQLYLSVNEAQRQNPRHSYDFILPVRFLSARSACVLFPIPFEQLASWDLRQGHSAYRSRAVSALLPLFSLSALRNGGKA